MSDDFNPTDWITTNEAAELTGYEAAHVRYLAKKGDIGSKKFGRDWMIDRESVQAYAEEMERLGAAKHDPWRSGVRQRVQEEPPERKWTPMTFDEIESALNQLDDPTTPVALAMALGYKTSVSIVLACKQGRIPGAEKNEGIWCIPLEGVREAVEKGSLRPSRKQPGR